MLLLNTVLYSLSDAKDSFVKYVDQFEKKASTQLGLMKEGILFKISVLTMKADELLDANDDIECVRKMHVN